VPCAFPGYCSSRRGDERGNTRRGEDNYLQFGRTIFSVYEVISSDEWGIPRDYFAITAARRGAAQTAAVERIATFPGESAGPSDGRRFAFANESCAMRRRTKLAWNAADVTGIGLAAVATRVGLRRARACICSDAPSCPVLPSRARHLRQWESKARGRRDLCGSSDHSACSETVC